MEQIPTPTILTPSKEEEKIIESKTFQLESNKKNIIEIKLIKNISKITIEGKYKNLSEPIIYYSRQSIDEIKINKYFLMFDNLNEVYEELINLIKNNKCSLIEENNKLIISIPIATTKIKEIKLILNQKEKSDKEKIEDLYSIIDNLKSYYDGKINILFNLIQHQNNKINELTNIIRQQDDRIKELNKFKKQQGININKIENQNIKKELNLNNFYDSLIVNNQIYISYLNQWINLREGPFKTKLLFRKSVNGNSYNEFHRLCDNQGKTIVLIQTKEGLIIGGYTSKDWNTSGTWYKDDQSFLFSLTKGRIFPAIKNCEVIRGRKEIGPWFAYIGFRDRGKNDLTQGIFYYGSGCYENYNEIIPNNGKDTYFDVKEVEIYKIIK